MVDWESFYAGLRRPDFVPGYVIEDHLGGGAFGEVYRARKTSIDKPYAIKFLKVGDDAGERAVARELEAVRHFATIDHPNLVTVEDVGVVEGIPFLVMGYAGEETLARLLARGPLDPERAMGIFVQICRGVLALHRRSLAHFDLKPSNVFLRGELVRIGDYGLAKLLVDGRQTLSFGRGTPHYMAPEMMRGRADHRADLYSLGVLLFECRAGRKPYFQAGEEGFVLREVDAPPEFPPGFPPELEAIVTRLLRIDPADRYPGVPALLEALGESTGSGGSPAAQPDEAPGGADGEVGGGEFRQAASELARGAVGVARGMWEGVVERVSEDSGTTVELREAGGGVAGPGAQGKETAAPKDGSEERALGSDVVSVSTLEEGDPGAGALAPVDPPNSAAAPWRQELERSRAARRREQGSGLLAVDASISGSAEESRSGTVPVPPRAPGGPVGNVLQSVVVGTEILGTLLTGPFVLFSRNSQGLLLGLQSGLPGATGRFLRFVFLLTFLALLGGLVAFLLLATLSYGA